MYGVILVAALASGTATEGCFFGRNQGCTGCYGGCSGCSGCYGGCTGCTGCYGARTGCYGGCAGCFGTSYGGWSNGYPGVNSGCYGVYGCYGCYGGWSCYGSGYSCYGQGVYNPTAPVLPPRENVPLPKPPVKIEETRAKVIIDVPAGAKLYIDNQLMASKSGQRAFMTPPLEADATYFYDVKIVTIQDGREQSFTDRVIIRQGDVVAARLTPSNGTATAANARR